MTDQLKAAAEAILWDAPPYKRNRKPNFSEEVKRENTFIHNAKLLAQATLTPPSVAEDRVTNLQRIVASRMAQPQFAKIAVLEILAADEQWRATHQPEKVDEERLLKHLEKEL